MEAALEVSLCTFVIGESKNGFLPEVCSSPTWVMGAVSSGFFQCLSLTVYGHLIQSPRTPTPPPRFKSNRVAFSLGSSVRHLIARSNRQRAAMGCVQLAPSPILPMHEVSSVFLKEWHSLYGVLRLTLDQRMLDASNTPECAHHPARLPE